MSLAWLEHDRHSPFPPIEDALEDGLLAVGGDLSTQRLLNAYRHGIFPWFNENDPILWWAPDPRMVLFTEQVKISKSLRKTLKKSAMSVTIDKAFNQVMHSCAVPRQYQTDITDSGTWIHPSMIEAYTQLHQQGNAHSVEVWHDDQLVGGLYGIAIGRIFFGESMFSIMRDSSKIALVALCQQLQRWQFPLIDCQIYSEHLASMGARNIKRTEFVTYLDTYCEQPLAATSWQLDDDLPLIL